MRYIGIINVRNSYIYSAHFPRDKNQSQEQDQRKDAVLKRWLGHYNSYIRE